jgi:hypothetical protein
VADKRIHDGRTAVVYSGGMVEIVLKVEGRSYARSNPILQRRDFLQRASCVNQLPVAGIPEGVLGVIGA